MTNGADISRRKPTAAATTAALLGIFAAAHAFYYLLGIRFDDTSLAYVAVLAEPSHSML